MDRVLPPRRQYSAAYIDDIIIHSRDWPTHLTRLTAVLDVLWQAGLTTNPAKCCLGLDEADYLGHTVGHGCVQPQTDKVQSIQTCPRPSTKKQVRTFLSLVSYNQIVPAFANTVAPLYNLTGKNQPNQVWWTPEAEDAFQALRWSLCNSPILATLDYTGPFMLQTDALDASLGAILSELQDGPEHPIV